MDSITLRRPDDMHVHLRSGPLLQGFVAATARQFARAVVMPNLKPPITTVALARRYEEEILVCVPGSEFEPLMTLYLTDTTSADEIRKAKDSGIIGVKYYPAGATTNSDEGVTNPSKIYPVLGVMEEVGLPLLLHGEVTGDHVDVFDREDLFLDELQSLTRSFPKLPIVLEHITTRSAAEFIRNQPSEVRIGATITAHHLLENRNAIFRGGINPHNYCLPILKREEDRLALVEAATCGDPRFFAGTDSAPHIRSTKERTCGCAGCFTAMHAVELYATAFERANAVDRLEPFMSEHGAQFYGLPLNEGTITVQRREQTIPLEIPAAGSPVVPFWAGQNLSWAVAQ